MSAAFQLPIDWEASISAAATQIEHRKWERRQPEKSGANSARAPKPDASLAFYRRHTESLLRRYLYASLQVGRAPSILSDPIARGWASSRPVRTFEDAIIFVLDIEHCLEQLSSLDRALLSRVVLQEYTQTEAAVMLGIGLRAISYKIQMALDRLTEKLLQANLLVLPQ
jgi:DNA-directed RNA polymerase specialized sigma24 family protein